MNQRSRRDYLQALGLVDWSVRPDGVLAAARTQPVDTEYEQARSQAPAEPLVAGNGASSTEVHAPRPAEQAAASRPSAASADDGLLPDTAPSRSAELATMDWDALEAWLAQQDHRGASRPVFGTGARDAEILIVGEAPGANEDAQGVPFVGRAGKLLDRMLFSIGCSRDTNVYITNICKFRPPDNRDPTADEVAADWPILERQIELMAPRLVVAVGKIAAQTLLTSKEPLGKLRGHMHRYPSRELDVLVTYHPAYLLRSPQQKAKAWDDLRLVAGHIASHRQAHEDSPQAGSAA